MAKPFAQLELRFTSWLRPSILTNKHLTSPLRHPDPDPALTAWCRDTALSLGHTNLARKVTVAWNPRMRTTAGRAWWPARKIELNPQLKGISEQEIWRTLKHEFAHLLAYERSGRRKIAPHGPEWRAACDDLGISGESVRHTLPFKARRLTRNHAYKCPACSAVITRVRPFRRPVACYTCCRDHNSGAYHPRYRLAAESISLK